MRSEIDRFGSAVNDNVRTGPGRHRTLFPAGTMARICRHSRSAMSSGAGNTKCWRLTFRGRGQRFIEPLMGWTGSTDPLGSLELKFPTLEAAIRYARRQALPFTVEGTVIPAPKDVRAGFAVVLEQAA
jgi:hypothetical protein